MLLDRDVELGGLERLLDEASAGAGRTVVIQGPAGIGKTGLLAASMARARQREFTVVRSRGSELERSMAFGVARQLFEPVLRSASPARRRRLTAGAAEVGARAIGVVSGQAPADRFAALHGLYWLCANLAVDDGSQAVGLMRDAVRALSMSASRLELARALTDYGAVLRRAGARTDARGPLEQGLDLAHGCGARAIAARARAELVATGAKPRRDAITGRDALTAAELRVARLAAQGMTNRQIGQALFITSRTASVHLSRAYRKLGIRSRAEIADALADHPASTGGAVPTAPAVS